MDEDIEYGTHLISLVLLVLTVTSASRFVNIEDPIIDILSFGMYIVMCPLQCSSRWRYYWSKNTLQSLSKVC